MNIALLGVGSYGISVMENSREEFPALRMIVIDDSKSNLESCQIATKIQISRRLHPEDAIDRISKKLYRSLSGSELVILLCNPADLANPGLLPTVARHIQIYGITTAGVVLSPSGKFEKNQRRAINQALELLIQNAATVVIPQKSISKYFKFNPEWEREYVCLWSAWDPVQEQAELHRWCQRFPRHDVSQDILAGSFFLSRLLEMVRARYVNIDSAAVCKLLASPGLIHFCSVQAVGKNQCELIRWRAAFNDLLHTSLDSAKGILLLLTVPKSIQARTLGFIFEGIHGRASEFAQFYFNISVDDSAQEISAKILATDAYDLLTAGV